MTQLASYFDPLVVASVGLASKLHDHQQQMTILDQTKTLSESALQMLYAAKEGGGNPKVQSWLSCKDLGGSAVNVIQSGIFKGSSLL